MTRRFAFLACLLLSWALASAPATAAQDIASVLTGEEKAAPKAIEFADIPEQANADERFAQSVMLQARRRDAVAPLQERLAAIEGSTRQKVRLASGEDLKTLPVLRLESLDRHWGFDARLFERWRADLKQASAPYVESAAEIATRRAAWEATRTANADGSMPKALSDRIDEVLVYLGRAESALSAPLQQYIELGRQANTLEAQIDAGRQEVAAAIADIDRRLVHMDAPPIWALGDDAGESDASLAALKTGLTIEVDFLKQYSASNVDHQRVLNVVQLLLLPLLVWLSVYYRRHQARLPVEPADAGTPARASLLEASEKVLHRPFSAWLLLSMMAVLALEPDAPLLLHQVIMLIALVPTLRLLPARVFELFGPWPYVATGLYLLQRLGFLFMANALTYRAYSLSITLLALVLTLWLLWRSRRKAPTKGLQGGARTAIHVVGWTAVGMLAVSALSNVLGNVSLAEMLTGGLLDSGYMALMLYAAVAVFLALLRLTFAQPGLSKLRMARLRDGSMMRGFSRLLGIAAVIAWLGFTANRFRLFRPIYSTISGILSHEFTIGALSISLGHVLVFIVSVVIAFWAAKLVRFVLHEEVLPKMSLPRGVDNSVASLSYYAVLLLGFVLALTATGFEVSQLAFVFGALGVGIGFGLQNVVNNFVSGLILMFERPIQPGDVVDITGTSGSVREIGMRATVIKTFDGADVVVPNGTLLSENLVNWTLRDMFRRIEINLGVAYGADPNQVIELMTGVITSDESVSRHPEPTVFFMAFGASSLDFSIRAWTRDYDNWVGIRSRLLTRIYAVLNENGIEIPFPQQDLHLRSVSEAARAALSPPSASKSDAGPGPAT
ncbi:mechanosensitive ion channel family protein [Marilutibacter aestuarii]|uniref:Mechanosensitive ion channel n=1 Tax=Marilutibacter aestuarii TaxID=1706195 RepID=A0A508ALG6_9GAMM|nr:mechanosensitive ion channel domain-containing protein [Lysobacter aestuarii]TQD50980.1 mechanosensitive ion channel [Lysobacter aestuarii]